MTQDPPPSPPAPTLALAELMCARLCHDLSGVIGLLASLLDLALSTAKEADEALTEAHRTALELTERLVVLRAAWTAGGDDLPVSRLQAIVEPFLRQKRIRLDAAALDGAAILPAPVGRMLLNVLLVCGEGLPRGGVITVAGEPDGAMLFAIDGLHAAWPAALAGSIADAHAALADVDDARLLQAPLAAAVAQEAGFSGALLTDGRADGAPALLRLNPVRAHAA